MSSATCYLGVFRLDVDAEATSELKELRTALRIRGVHGVSEIGQTEESDEHPEGVLIDEHRPTGARAKGEFLISESVSDLTVLADTPVELDNSRRWFGRIRVTPLGVGALEVWSRSPYESSLERESVEPCNVLLKQLTEALADSGFLAQDDSDFALPAGRILWWHRIQFADDEDSASIVADGSAVAELNGGRRLSVGDGFSTLLTTQESDFVDQAVFGEVIEGIYFAQEDYLILDRSGRELDRYLQLTSQIEQVSRRDLIAIEEEGWRLSRLGHGARLYMDERNRFLACTRRQSWALSLQAWGIEREISTFQAKIDAIRDLSVNVVSALQARQDGARNLVLFSLAIIAALQGALIAFDFSVSDDVTLNHPLRFGAALFVLCVSVGVATFFATRAFTYRKKGP